jgi:hypothetical protein
MYRLLYSMIRLPATGVDVHYSTVQSLKNNGHT